MKNRLHCRNDWSKYDECYSFSINAKLRAEQLKKNTATICFEGFPKAKHNVHIADSSFQMSAAYLKKITHAEFVIPPYEIAALLCC